MIRGSCLCGSVSFALDEPPKLMNICHCSMCRKVSGSSYGTFAHSSARNFRWLSGENVVKKFESSPEHWRAFCPTCGGNVPTCNAEAGSVCIPAGCFDDDPQIRPTLQIFAGSRAPWHELAAEPVAYDAFDPD